MDLKERYSVSKDVITEEQVNHINELLSELQDDAFWTRRENLGPSRGVDGQECAYDFMGHTFMPGELREYLLEIVPREEGYFLGEICINRYKPGDYIGKHKDRAAYRMNRVIALQENGDGIYIDDEDRFIEDVKGQAVTIQGVGPVHSVPPAKNLRHVLIVLYE